MNIVSWALILLLSVATTHLEGDELENVIATTFLAGCLQLLLHAAIETCLVPKRRKLFWRVLLCCMRKAPQAEVDKKRNKL